MAMSCDCCYQLIELKLNAIIQLLIAIQTGKAVDLSIVFGSTPPTPSPAKGSSTMANKKATGSPVSLPCFAHPSSKKKMVMPALTLTDPAPSSITLQALDVNGGPVVAQPGDSITATLTSDNSGFVITPGADASHFVGTIPANTPFGTVANLAATESGTIGGAPASGLTSSIQLTLNIPPSPVAVDLAIIFA